jgi:hypothetical protein
MRILLPAMILSLSAIAPASADASERGSVVRLSDAEAEAAKEAAARRNAARLADPDVALSPSGGSLIGPVHGEVGFGIGTGGW